MTAQRPTKERRTSLVVAPLLLAACLGSLRAIGSERDVAPRLENAAGSRTYLSLSPEPVPFEMLPLLQEAHATYSNSKARGSTWATVAEALPEFLEDAGIEAADTAEFVKHFRERDHVVVVVWLGERPTGGYGVEFLWATSSADGTMTVWVAESSPPGDAYVTQAYTSPVAAFLLPWHGEKDIGVAWGTPASEPNVCSALNGQHVAVSGIMGEVDTFQLEPGATTEWHFDLLRPDWTCPEQQVHVISYGMPVFCAEGLRARVTGLYLSPSPTFPSFNSIDMDSLECLL